MIKRVSGPTAPGSHIYSRFYAFYCLANVMMRKSYTQPLKFSKARNIHERALAATACWLAMGGGALTRVRMKRLIESGANCAVHEWLPLRMAACARDAELISWLAARSCPSKPALVDAKNWASQNGHHAALSALNAMEAFPAQ